MALFAEPSCHSPSIFFSSFVFSIFDVNGYMHMSASVCGVQRRVSVLLELEVQVVGSCPVCMLGTELGSSTGLVLLLRLGLLPSTTMYYL